MKEDAFADLRAKLSKNADQPAWLNSKASTNASKSKSHSSWGSQIVRGLTGDKKAKLQSPIPTTKKIFAGSEIPKPKNQSVQQLQSRVKRSLISDFPCAVNPAQVHPQGFDCQSLRSPASHNLFLELDNLRSLLQESKERESILQAELLSYKDNPKIKEYERDLDTRRREIENLTHKVNDLEGEKTNLSEQLCCLSSALEHQEEISKNNGELSAVTDQLTEKGFSSQKNNLEMEVVELRRLNKELQLQKRNLALKLASTESQLLSLKKVTESDIVAKAEAEALLLRHTNEDLCKQVEGLQMCRLNEVEELAYLRWMNSCLRQELQNSDNQTKSPLSKDAEEKCFDIKNVKKDSSCAVLNLQKLPHPLSKSASIDFDGSKGMAPGRMVTWQKIEEDCQVMECDELLDKEWIEANEGRSPGRRHSISGPRDCSQVLKVNKRRQSDGFVCQKDFKTDTRNEKPPAMKNISQIAVHKHDFISSRSPRFSINKSELTKSVSLEIEKRALRIPNPPPRPSGSLPAYVKTGGLAVAPPPPPPPPPPPKFSAKNKSVMQRAPEVVELYHSLMKRDSKKEKDSSNGVSDAPNVANVRSSMIGEIENRSSHLLAIKADVETQGEFVRLLIKEVNEAVYRDIEDVVAFVKWLDDELSFLVDERAVLKHFDWPEKKADALREAAFGFHDLKKLEAEAMYFEDNPRLSCDAALKKIASLSEKMEHSVYNLLRTRDGLIIHYKEYHIPTDWMLDSAIISKIKFASVKLAKKYMKRVASELQAMEALDKDPALDYMLLQGVRFAFRIHQFAGGFDAETMRAFEELRNLAHAQKKN